MADTGEHGGNGLKAGVPGGKESAGPTPGNSVEPKEKQRLSARISIISRRSLGVAVGLATIVGAIVGIYQIFAGGGSAQGKGGSTSSSRPFSGVDRSPILGLQFQQDGSLAPMTVQSYQTADIVTVSLQRAPFYLIFPALGASHALGINVRDDRSGFNIVEGAPIVDNPSFRAGTGFVGYQYGGGSLIVAPDGQNYFIGTRVESGPDGTQRIYVASFISPRSTTPITEQRNSLYLTVFWQTPAQQTIAAQVSDRARFAQGSFEYFILKFH
ncbi:MAG TPA: hypothetical protein VGS19_07510 [Streptosporangiaceae bacterium]|nr:hypothetical protein [Streptosporangiaceae bacterium]